MQHAFLRFLLGPLGGLALVVPSIASGDVKVLDANTVKRFVELQDRAWQDRDFGRFYATFDSRAIIVTIGRGKRGEPVTTRHTLAEDRRLSGSFFASTQAQIRETDRIQSIKLGSGGKSAVVRVRERTTVNNNGKIKLLYAVTEQELVLRKGTVISLGLTEDDR
jgi:hypothetical protein